MVYAPQRRHAAASLATTIQALGVLQHLYTPNILILVSRMLAQVQITAAAYMHEKRSLLALFVMLTAMNLVAVLLHMLDFASGLNGTKGLILDFVGQSHPASMTRILLLDGLLWLLQLTSLLVTFINDHGPSLPAAPSLPYDDLLLPPDSEYTDMTDEPDLESGKLRRRKGKGVQYEELPDDDNELWLDDHPGKGTSSSSHLLASTANPNRRREPPLIFSLPLSHIITLIFRLPAPPPAPRAFSGATPAASPRPSPVAERTLPAVLTPRMESAQNEDGEESEGELEARGSPSGRTRARGAAGLMPDIGRIPGDYWVGRDRGDG